ncbi:MAG TPA: 2-amino-4-hydroxy-6-hydroxymethyldihydropteridine diphosphokinase [Haliangiales bacterium]|nr:2-amino-4-hydroxy-6-hydroxymethyldihydropteridine diphosphokinase [Haliangiales bacterium]
MSDLAYIGLGGNVGDVAATFGRAAAGLAALPGVAGVRLSSLWETAPVGPVREQPAFLNAAAELSFSRAPAPVDLLRALLDIERRLGRDRSREVPGGPRAIDLDFLLWGDRVVDEPELRLPHPRLHARAFALAPLVELAPHATIPGAGRAAALLVRLGDQRIRKITGSGSA